MRRLRHGKALALVVLLLAAAPFALATTWVDIEVTCPVCGTVNVFQVPASYGTYVYEEPSRLQYVFWPATTDRFLYTCRECHYTAYMGDFEELPEAKVSAIATMLEREGAIPGALVPYYEIAMSERLAVAEKVYGLLERDDAFWGEFYRIEGFHLAEAGRADEAKLARLRALEAAERLLEASRSTRKETLFIIGSMRLFTGDARGARAAMSEAKNLTYESSEQGLEVSQQVDRYLNELIADFETELLGPQKLD
jgi:hypothetical protein